MTEYFLYQERKFILEQETILPTGYFLAQYGEDIQVLGDVRECATNGCPAVMVLNDAPDTIFNEQWQFFLYAINRTSYPPDMELNAVIALEGTSKALFNTGKGIPPCKNALTGDNGNGTWPRLDKLRTFSRATHAVMDYDETRYKILTLDGNHNPPLKSGMQYPDTKEHATIDIYKYTPMNAMHLFMACNSIKTKPGNQTSVFPFAHGAVYDWTVASEDPYSFFPLVSWFPTVLSLKKNWNRVNEIGNPYRRVS